MRITNTQGLPAPLVAAASAGTQRTPQPGRISVTELINPPQMRLLIREHWDEIEEDVGDRVWALVGTALHDVLERYAHVNTLAEERLAVFVNGWTVSGRPDLYTDDGTLSDWKFTSVWSIILGQKADWVTQTNVYAALLRAHSFPVTKLQIVAILRDWQRSKAERERDYPQRQVTVVPVPLWPAEQAWGYIEERVHMHQTAQHAAIPFPCTPEERWEKPTQYAVYKGTNKRAARVLDSEDAATGWAKENIGFTGWRIEKRPGESTRCASFCNAASWCPQWAEIRAQQEQA